MGSALLFGLLAFSLASLGASVDKPAGYLAEPKSGHGRCVLVLHPWWGLNGDVKAYCDRLAAEGFVAFAPDLFHGKVVTTPAEAEALVQAYEPKHELLEAQIADATKFLVQKTGGRKIAVVGFSFGAYYALHLSNAEPTMVGTTVVYYGTGQQEFGASKSSYLGHFAEHDDFEPKAAVEGLTKLLESAGRPETIYTYPGTGHWFAEPSVKSAYDKASAELAWERTLAFLRKGFGEEK